ncbi:MAG TPA: YcxB family protein [Gemmatales bacterium]|nr:YcxB family protein [Gemmatales bacterium]
MVEFHSSLTFTGETYQEAAKLLYSRQYQSNVVSLQQRPVLMVIFIAITATVLFLLMEFPWLDEMILPLVCLFAGVVLGVVLCVIYALKLSKRTYQSQLPVEYSYIFRDHAIEITQPFAHAIYSWEAIKRIVQGEKYWLLILTNNENLFLPLDAVSMSQGLKDYLLSKVILVTKVKGQGEELA